MPGRQPAAAGGKSKVAAGLFAIFLGAFGVHKFYLGYTTEGILAIVLFWILGLVTVGFGMVVMGVVFLVEGILYLTKSDEEFERIYVQSKRGWF